VLDRDGVNQVTGVIEPYWTRQTVPGGSIGGVIASAAIAENKVLLSTAIGTDISNPQKPAAWGLDAATGDVLWNSADAQPSYSAASAIPGVVFMGSLAGTVVARDSDTGAALARLSAGGSLGSSATVVDGKLFVGAGAGERGGNPTDISYVVTLVPSPVSAFCVAGAPGCPETGTCDDGDGCTIDTQTASGCSYAVAPDGTSCSLGDLSGQCETGVCIIPGATCPAVSQCTRATTSRPPCKYESVPDGTSCTTGAGGGQCLAGNCIDF
jgi:hypothetical protein